MIIKVGGWDDSDLFNQEIKQSTELDGIPKYLTLTKMQYMLCV